MENTTFFTQLSALFGHELRINITRTGEKLTVGLFPYHKDEEVSSRIKPIIVTGTPQELDEEFFKTITPVMEETKGIIAKIDGANQELKELEIDKKGQVEKKKTEPKNTPKAKKEKPSKPVKQTKSQQKAAAAEAAEDKEEGPAEPQQPSMFS